MHFCSLFGIVFVVEPTRKPYSTDCNDDEWAFVSPYLTLMTLDAPQRNHDLREIYNALRWIVRAGSPWRLLPTNFPPWQAVYQQTQRWIEASCFEDMAHDLRVLLRTALGRNPQPTAAVFDSQTLQGTPESGERAGYDAAKKKKGTKLHLAVDTLGHLLALVVTPANEQDRHLVGALAEAVQEATNHNVSLGYVDQGYAGPQAEEATAPHGIALEVVKLPEARRGFVLVPRRWVVERTFAWKTRFVGWSRIMSACPKQWQAYTLPFSPF